MRDDAERSCEGKVQRCMLCVGGKDRRIRSSPTMGAIIAAFMSDHPDGTDGVSFSELSRGSLVFRQL